MLQSIRDRIQGWIAGVIVAILAVVFALFGIEYYINQSTGSSASVAKVNSQKITENELNSLYQRLSNQELNRTGGVPLSSQQQKALKQYALQSLVTKAALLQSADKNGFRVNNQQVQQVLEVLPQFQENGQFSPQRLQQIIYASGLNPTQFFQELQETMTIGQVEQGMGLSSFVLPNELKKVYLLFNERRNFGYFTIPSAKFANEVTVTDNQIEQFYQQNKEQYVTPEKVKVSYLILSAEDLAKKYQITDEQLKQYYETNKDSFKVPQRWQIQQILVPLSTEATTEQVNQATQQVRQIAALLAQGKTIEEISQNKNLPFETSTQWLGQTEISSQLENFLQNLKPQQYSNPLRTKQGFAILKLLQMQAAHTRSFTEVESQLRSSLQRQKVQQEISNLSDQLANLTYTNPTTLEVAAKKLNLQIQTSDFITKQGTKEGVLADPRVLAAVFSNNVLQQGNNSNPITLKNGSIVVVRVDQQLKSHALSLSEVAAEIKDRLTKQMMQKKAGLLAYQVQTDLEKGEATADIAKKYQMEWVEKQAIPRDDKSLPAMLISTVFNLAPTSNKPKPVTSVLLNNGDYLVVQLQGINDADYAKAEKTAVTNLQNNLMNFWGRLDYQFYVSGVMSRAEIHIYKKKKT